MMFFLFQSGTGKLLPNIIDTGCQEDLRKSLDISAAGLHETRHGGMPQLAHFDLGCLPGGGNPRAGRM